VFLKIEPPVLHSPVVDQTLEGLGFCRSADTNQPRASIVLDLRPDLDSILLKMRKKTRQYIHNALREGMDVRLGDIGDIPAYIRMMQDTAKRERFSGRSQRFYAEEWKTFSEANQGVLLLACHQDQIIAVRTAYSFGRCAAEFHGGSVEKSTDLHPNYLLVWKAIQWAKERGCESYDMWGIPDEAGQMVCEGNPLPVSDRTDGLWGVYRFKTGFSKTVEYYAGAFDYIYQPRIYRLINHVIINRGNIEALSSRLDPRK
ncbi:MAG: peptidoglycan bridge formation glycyltransferase FemA/FemB family protein, partial [Anaerolineaceae bacterium]